MNTTPSPAIEAVELPPLPNAAWPSGTSFNPEGCAPDDAYDADQMRAYALSVSAAKQEEVDKVRAAATKAADVFAGTPWRNWKIDKALKELRAALSPSQGNPK